MTTLRFGKMNLPLYVRLIFCVLVILIPSSKSQGFRKPKNARKNNGQGALRNMLIQATSMSSYAGLRPVTMPVMSNNIVFATPVSGNYTIGLPISLASVSASVARFGSVFDECRILSAKVRLIPLTASNGFTSFFWSEKQLASVTLTTQAQRLTRDIANSNGAGTGYVMNWKANGFSDLTWDPIASPTPAAYFYVITDTNFGTPGVAQSLWNIQIEYTAQFRGLASQ